MFPDHPHPTDMGSRVRNLRILETLSREYELTTVSMLHDPSLLGDPGPVAGLGRWVPIVASHRRGLVRKVGWHLLARWEAATHGLHPETFFQSLPVLARTVEGLLAAGHYDIVHSAYWYGLRRAGGFTRPPLWVVDTHDVQFERHERLWGRRSPRERRMELRQLCRYDRIVAITERDRGTFLKALPRGAPPVEVIGMGLDFGFWDPGLVSPALPPAPRAAFYGNLTSSSNQDAARHLVRDVFPSVRDALPDAEALVIGPGAPADLCGLAEGNQAVRLTGFVDDPREWLLSARVLALTLRTGSGQRGRVVECLALGVPVVGYPEALEGLDLEPGEGIVVAGTQDDLAAAVTDLLRDPEKAACLGKAGRDAVRARYGWEKTYGLFLELYRNMLA